MDGLAVQFYMHIMDALYLRHFFDSHQSPSNESKYELCLCEFLSTFLLGNAPFNIFQGNDGWGYCRCLVSLINFTIRFDAHNYRR